MTIAQIIVWIVVAGKINRRDNQVSDKTSRRDGSTGSAHAVKKEIGYAESDGRPNNQSKLLSTLEHLLAIEGTDVKSTLNQAADLIADSIQADKVDAFLYDPSKETLVAVGTSHTPMGIRQRQIGLDRLPLANGGPEVHAFQTGECYHTGHADQDPTIPPGIIHVLGVRSMMVVPMNVGGNRRGVLQSCSAQVDAFSADDLDFLEAVAHWLGTMAHRAELVERISQDAATQARQVVADELITVLAHDLGNYLTPLEGWVTLVRRRANREGRERDVQDLGDAILTIKRLHAMISDMLDVGRLDQGLFHLSRQPVDLVALAQETTGTMQSGKLNIVLRAPDELPVQADPKRIRQALENLISNALKHSPAGAPIEVTIQEEKRQDGDVERVWAVISVHDQGPGIPADLRPSLFKRFASGPNSTGLGLGLYLARSIAEAHGGTLTVDSSPGQGTTFYLALPVSA